LKGGVILKSIFGELLHLVYKEVWSFAIPLDIKGIGLEFLVFGQVYWTNLRERGIELLALSQTRYTGVGLSSVVRIFVRQITI